ncbi:hypothetical protein QCA50_019621 [Cerrena zonata]|uniref:Uncharacterized protein n=1 Tax=Cerrena zonata TaxID=2478898 RepID=A0AAW0FEC7_9APHY
MFDNNPTAVPGYSSGTKVESAIDTAIKGAAVEKRDKAASALSSQSASPGRELFLTLSPPLDFTQLWLSWPSPKLYSNKTQMLKGTIIPPIPRSKSF